MARCSRDSIGDSISFPFQRIIAGSDQQLGLENAPLPTDGARS
jgi:hypothetical protein